jgi:hypothetical protein
MPHGHHQQSSTHTHSVRFSASRALFNLFMLVSAPLLLFFLRIAMNWPQLLLFVIDLNVCLIYSIS